MENFYCFNCGEKVEEKLERCPKCNTSLNNGYSSEKLRSKGLDGHRIIYDFDQRNTIDFYLLWSKVIKIIDIIIIIIGIIISIACFEATDGISLVIALVCVPFYILFDITFRNMLKYKAFLLYNTLETQNTLKLLCTRKGK